MDEAAILPQYKLFIRPIDLRELRRDIWIDDPIPAQLTIEGKRLDIDIAYRGSHIRDLAKKSYQVSFYKPKKFRGSKHIHLNAEFKDPSLIRNKLSFDFFAELGVLSPQSRHIFLNQNGKAEGVYLEIESVDENFLKRRNLPNGSIYYAVDGDANFSLMSDLDKETKKSLQLGYERIVGGPENDYFLHEFIFNINTLSKSEFEKEIQKYVDIDKYLRWVAGVIFTSNYDGFVHNYALYRNGESHLFEIIPWDYDATWGRDVNGKIMEPDYVPIDGFNTLTARILYVESFRKRYRLLLEGIMEQHFTVENMIPKVEKLTQLIRPFVSQDPYKKQDIDLFDRELSVITNYIEERRKYLYRKLAILD
ncbi:CotH kinase family protein [Neobacillus drentensis]|uniref:CotH kinase family protein n=1 Tax=Neobacillus drentensis TaxID=220684 RepID=UPI0028619522|nr:CotH kinase family protein [Neobacillus drentensis]MDR7240115.1 spore coat protein H [Neobacillus drentensis]